MVDIYPLLKTTVHNVFSIDSLIAVRLSHRLPGKTFVTNETIWLCNAHQAESRVFSRSLLAKASIWFMYQLFNCNLSLKGVHLVDFGSIKFGLFVF